VGLPAPRHCRHVGTSPPTLHPPAPGKVPRLCLGPNTIPGSGSSILHRRCHPLRGPVSSTLELQPVPSGCRRPRLGAPAHPEEPGRCFKAPSPQGTRRGPAGSGHGEWALPKLRPFLNQQHTNAPRGWQPLRGEANPATGQSSLPHRFTAPPFASQPAPASTGKEGPDPPARGFGDSRP